jgi:hypothetical protein
MPIAPSESIKSGPWLLEYMPRSKEKRKTRTGTEEILDSYESWLKRQRPKDVKSKAGFTGGEQVESKAS